MHDTRQQDFHLLFEEHYEKMCRYAFSYVKDEQSAEDVVQETFVKLWEQKQDLLGKENMKFYLIASVRNNCISFLRKQKNTTILSDVVPDVEPDISPIPRIEKEHQTETAQRIKQALDLLPPKCREVFLLIKMHGLTYKQCADQMGLSVKTIENQMTKAIKTFRNENAAHSLFALFIPIKIISSIGVLEPFFVYLFQ